MPLKLALFNLQKYIKEEEFASEFQLRGGVRTLFRLLERNDGGMTGNSLAVCILNYLQRLAERYFMVVCAAECFWRAGPGLGDKRGLRRLDRPDRLPRNDWYPAKYASTSYRHHPEISGPLLSTGRRQYHD